MDLRLEKDGLLMHIDMMDVRGYEYERQIHDGRYAVTLYEDVDSYDSVEIILTRSEIDRMREALNRLSRDIYEAEKKRKEGSP